MPKDGVDWKAEEEYLEEIGFFDEPSSKKSPGKVLESFQPEIREMARRLRERLKSAGHEDYIVSVGVKVSRTGFWTDTLVEAFDVMHGTEERIRAHHRSSAHLLDAMWVGGLILIAVGVVFGQVWALGAGFAGVIAPGIITLVNGVKPKK